MQAGGQFMAAHAVHPFKQVGVFSQRTESSVAFVAESRARYPGLEILDIDNAEKAVQGADMIMSFTSSLVRLLEPSWLRPGMHVTCIKS